MRNIMKSKKYIFAALSLTGILSLSSCAEDFLDQTNSYQLNQETFFDSDEAVAQATAPLYSYVWYDFNDKFYYGMGDGRANNITAQYSNYIYPYTNFSETAISAGLTEAWGALYSVVSQANNTINNIANYSTSGVSESAKNAAIAEARFMRGTAYWYIASLWGVGVIYENTADLVNNYVVKPAPGVDVMLFAIRDLEYAAYYLPAAQADAGRVTKYSAYGMLSRVYLSMAGLTKDGEFTGTANGTENVATNFNRGTRNTYYLNLARKAALQVIQNSSNKLVDSYADLFSPELSKFNNNSEVLFQLQILTGAGVGGAAQSMTRFLAWSAMVTDTNAWGGATYCSWDLWEEFKEYADPTLGVTIDDAIRRHNCVASYGEAYPEISVDPSDPYIYGETENAGNQGANVKKYVNGTNKCNGYSQVNNSGLNTYMMRLAEVYLNYAEAVLGNEASTTDSYALELFNMLRTRAGVPVKASISYEDLRHERRMEFAFEGLYWYDLLRRSYYQQQEVINYVNNQNRNASYYSPSTHAYELSENYVAPGDGVAIATALNLTLPMADADQTKNPYLKPTRADADAVREYDTEAWTFGEKAVSDSQLYDGIN